MNNVATYGGGAANATLNNCTVSQNEATNGGGGVSGGTANNCTITGNRVLSSDGGFGGGVAGVTANNCIIMANTVTGWRCSGGGAAISTLRNCLIVQNEASYFGGGVSGGTTYNCTIVANVAGTPLDSYLASGQGAGTDGGTHYNTIVWGNLSQNLWGNINTYGGNFYSSLSPYDEYATYHGYGNLSGNPMFVGGGYSLSAASPCINTGDNAHVLPGSLDLAGNVRIMHGRVDMGAYEFGSTMWLNVAPDNQTVPCTGGVFNVSVGCPATWTAACTSPWVKLGASGGIGDGALSFTVATNATLYGRTATISLKAGAFQTMALVTQEPTVFEIGDDVGSATSSANIPFHFYYNNSAVQSLYLQSDLEAITNSVITGIDYYYSGGTIDDRPAQVWMAHTPLNDLSGGWIATNTFTLVFDGEVSVSGASTLSILLDTSFPYTNGTLCVMTILPTGSPRVNNVNAYRTAVPTNRTRAYSSNSSSCDFAISTGSLLAFVPNIGFRLAPPCTVTTPVEVPHDWLDQWEDNIADYEALAWSEGDNGVTFWESYVAGLIPTNANSRLRITRFARDDDPAALCWDPHRHDRTYTIHGKTNLTDVTPWMPYFGDNTWGGLTNSGLHFFRIRVEMPR